MFKKSIEIFIDENVITPKERLEQQQRKQPRKWQQEHKLQKQEPADHLLALLRARLLDQTGMKISTNCSRLYRFLMIYLFYVPSIYSHHSHAFHSVKELRKAGIALKPSETSCLKHISFAPACFPGTLHLPPVMVDDSTGPKFMNLVAYEMCPDFRNDLAVTSYICFLDSLIAQAEDVKALREAGIFINALGSDEVVAELFTKMSKELVPNPKFYPTEKRKIQTHFNRWPIRIYVNYFTQTWSLIAFLGAVAGLVLAAIQAYYTIHPPQKL